MIEINLLPWRAARKKRQRYQEGLKMLFALVFSTSLLFGVHLSLMHCLKKLQGGISQTQHDLDQVSQRFAAIDRFSQAGEFPKGSGVDFSAILSHQRRILHFLRLLTKALPETLEARQLHFDDGSWSLEGRAQDVAGVLRFVEQLRHGFKNESKEFFSWKEKQLKINPKGHFFDYQLRYEIHQ